MAGISTAPPERYVCGPTGFAVGDDHVWGFYTSHGALAAFGCPISRLFVFKGFAAQFFERRIVQLDPQGEARLLNVLDPEFLPYTHINGSTFPAVDPQLKLRTPDVDSPTYVPDMLALLDDSVPDSFEGMPVKFHQHFFSLVTPSVAGTSDATLLAMLNLDLWGAPTSPPMREPTNSNLVYQRFQRQIMTYDAACDCIESPLLAGYLKDIIVGNPLPPDLDADAQSSPLYHQYAPGAPLAVRDPALLPNTDLTDAFSPP